MVDFDIDVIPQRPSLQALGELLRGSCHAETTNPFPTSQGLVIKPIGYSLAALSSNSQRGKLRTLSPAEFTDPSRIIQEQHHGPLDPIVSAAMDNVTDPQKPKHLEVAMIMDSLGNEFGKCTEYFTQKELPQQSVEVFERQHGPEHPQVATTLGFRKLGDYKEQKQALERYLKVEKCLGLEHLKLAKMLNSLTV